MVTLKLPYHGKTWRDIANDKNLITVDSFMNNYQTQNDCMCGLTACMAENIVSCTLITIRRKYDQANCS